MRTLVLYALVLCALMLCIHVTHAQDVPPTSIRHGSTPVPDSLLELFTNERPKFIRGFNWGPAPRRTNHDMHANFWHVHNPFAWSGTSYDTAYWKDPSQPLNQSVSGMRLVVAPDYFYSREWLAQNLPWYSALDDSAAARGEGRAALSFGGADPLALTEAMGIRFQPELEIDTASFTPMQGDKQGAVFGFRTRRGGVVEGERYVLRDRAPNVTRLQSTLTNFKPLVVLDNSWPSDKFLLWSEGAHQRQASPFNGKRMYLAINMRRVPVSDTISNPNVIDRAASEESSTTALRIRIMYRLCSDTTQYSIEFDSVAHPLGARRALPTLLDTTTAKGYRGQISQLIPTFWDQLPDDSLLYYPYFEYRRNPELAKELVVTPHMLPSAYAEHPDATILAHFTIDTNRYLLRDVWRGGGPCGAEDSGRIVSMSVQVTYEGGTDVAIDWIQVGTENMTWLTQGWYDRYADTVYRTILKQFRAYNKQNAERFGGGKDGLRILSWYNRDEGGQQYWEGMRYMHQLFDGLTTTERTYDDAYARFNYNVMSSLGWQGNMPFPTTHTAAPYYQQGYNPAMRTPELFLETEWGMKNMDLAHRIDYDARWGSHKDGSVELPIDTTIQYYPGGAVFASGSWQQCYESQRRSIAMHPDFLFNPSRPWIANPWVFSQWETNDTNKIPLPVNVRFPTGEEVRLELYSQLILGAKGFALFWGANKTDATRPVDYSTDAGGAAMGFAYGPTPSRIDEAGSSAVRNIIEAPLSSPLAGPDYLLPSDRTGLYEALNRRHPYTVANIARTLGVAPDKLYLGFRSTRMAIAEVFDKTMRAEDILSRLQLVTWFSKGFRSWTVGDTSALARIVGTDAHGIKTRHPMRPSPSGSKRAGSNRAGANADIADYEPFDSSFVELSLLRVANVVSENNIVITSSDTASGHSLDSVFVLGVLNRRCNPFAFTDTNVDHFISLAEHDDGMVLQNRSRQRNPEGGMERYEQQGAREIRLRFNYAHPDGKRRILHVKALGEVADRDRSFVPIDVRIPQDGTLRVLCLPGEGKMLWVEVQELRE